MPTIHDMTRSTQDTDNPFYKQIAMLALAFVVASLWASDMIRLLLFVLALSYIWLSRHRFRVGSIRGIGLWHRNVTARGWHAWILALGLTLIYCFIYWKPQLLGLGGHGQANSGVIGFFDPLSYAINGHAASQWFVYGFLYTWVVLVSGIDFIRKYRHNRYQVYRTISVLFFQLVFAFVLPEIFVALQYPYFDLKHFWPLDYSFFFDWRMDSLLASGHVGLFLLVWGIVGFLVITPLMTWYYGKRWYCSWVCGCGALAETAGDSFRHLSDKSLLSWKIEKWTIYPILAFSILMTVLVLYTRFTGREAFLGVESASLSHWYGFYIGSLFSGVAGVGLYPILGNRVWCRFGCPLAAYMGLIQTFKASINFRGKKRTFQPHFRISTNGGQCISCGQCSTQCEMGIDVKSYAERGEDIIRASCVGCGICSEVCPRGVLHLELTKPIVLVGTQDMHPL